MILSASYFWIWSSFFVYFFWYFFVFGSFLEYFSHVFYNFFFLFWGGQRCVFENVEIMWSNFKKSRDASARADPAVRARWNVQKKSQKNAKNPKNHIFWTKKSPLKSVKRHLDGHFLTTPCRMFSFAEPPHFDFVS